MDDIASSYTITMRPFAMLVSKTTDLNSEESESYFKMLGGRKIRQMKMLALAHFGAIIGAFLTGNHKIKYSRRNNNNNIHNNWNCNPPMLLLKRRRVRSLFLCVVGTSKN